MLGKPTPIGLITHWTVQPVAIALAVLIAALYLRGLRRINRPWPAGRTAATATGLLLLIWTSCGSLQVYRDSLYWAWTTQHLILWLVVPIVILSGHPVQLARATSTGSAVDRFLGSRFVRIIGNPLVGPALVPVLSAVLFFGPVPEWSVRWHAVGWLIQLALLAIGALMVLPLVGLDEEATSLAVGLSLMIGSFELVLDALPGVVLRLHNSLVTGWFDHRIVHSWSPTAIHDQRSAGGVLWCIAEIIDLPFLVIVFRRWLRADARDAAEADAVLEAERAARRALQADEPQPVVEHDEPWWLSDPRIRERFREPE